MMWHDKQNAVCLERSRCSFRPQKPQRIGRAQNARKPRIFPAGVAVNDERVISTISNTIVVSRRTKSIKSGPGIVPTFDAQYAAVSPSDSLQRATFSC